MGYCIGKQSHLSLRRYISLQIFKDVGFTCLALTIVVTLSRFYLRCKYRILEWDDFFNGLALMCLIGYSVLPDSDDQTDPSYWKLQLADNMLIWVTLWLVKASFLALIWSIFNISKGFRRAWWIAMIFTFLAFWPCFFNNLWQCGLPSKYGDPAACIAFSSDGRRRSQYDVTSIINIALHTSSELLILALPLTFIRNLQMSRAQKFNAASFFCLIFFTVVIGLVRNSANFCGLDICATFGDIAGVFEPIVAVFVCALPPYKILIAKFKKDKSIGVPPRDLERDPAAPRANGPR